MNVSKILKKKGNTCQSTTPDTLLVDAIRVMMQNRIGSLVVMEGGKLISIITERDVLHAVDTYGADIGQVRVKDLMSPQLVTCTTRDSVDKIMDMMIHNVTKRRIRHLPVVENGELLGLVSIGDVVDVLLTETRFENQLLKNYIKNWPDTEKA